MAIAFDASSSGSGVTTSLSYSHTCTGSDRILFTGMNNNTASATITGVTYAGTSMTQVDALVNSATNTYLYMFILVAPSSGANNVVITASPSTNINSMSQSYTGASQTGQPDAHGTVTASVANNALQTKSLTTTADNCWMVSYCHGAGDPPTADSNVTERVASGNAKFGDNNTAITPAGSYSMSWKNLNGYTIPFTTLAATFAPSVAAPATGNAMFMGANF